jgi:hypothetical protein
LACVDSKSLSNSFDLSIRICRCGSIRWWGTQCKCLTTNPKDPVRRRQTVAHKIYVDFASSRTDGNGVWLRAWRIALSITSRGGLNAALRSELSSETRAGMTSPSSNRLHRIRWSAQIHHGLPWLKVHSCWDRDKLCIDPLCCILSLNIKFLFCTKKRCLLDHKSKYKDFILAKYVPMMWAMKSHY